MKNKADRIKNLAETFAALLEQERVSSEDAISSLIEAVRSPQGTESQRALYMTGALKRLQEKLNLLAKMARDDFLEKITSEAQELSGILSDTRAATVLASLIEIPRPSVKAICESLLDRLIEATRAERGFILFYFPESTQAEVFAARNFKTRNLSLEEYSFSRSLLREVFERGEALLLKDASSDSAFSKEASVVRLALKSVLAAPMIKDGRAVGALYLENNSLAGAFDEDDLKMVDSIAQFAVFHLDNARLLPVVFERDASIFFDEGRASKEIIGRDPKILAMLDLVNRIADLPAPVLIEGESGTGKELVARALHFQSLRRNRPFVAINCAAIPENLLESELFGHEKGAFTGATERQAGRIEQAQGGTLFLDEISQLAYPLQAKLLRFLQSYEFQHLGGRKTIKVDARVVAATSKDLKEMAGEGRFQDALFYRLNVIPIRVPPLRERKSDIRLLIEHFLDKFAEVYRRKVSLDREARERLSEYGFPGNVRELENLIHRLVALSMDGSVRVADLPVEIVEESKRISLENDSLYSILLEPPVDFEDLKWRKGEIERVLAEQERQLAERAIKEAGGNVSEAARRSGKHRVTLHNLRKESKKADR